MPTPAPAPDPWSVPKRARHVHFSIITGAASVLNAVAVIVLTTQANRLGPVFMSWIAEWWGLVEGVIVLLQLPPLVGTKPLQERKEVLDVITSCLDAGVIWLLIPGIYMTAVYFSGGIFNGQGWFWPNHYAWKIWVTSLPAALIDLLLLLVLLEIAKTVQRFSPNP